MAGAEQAPNRDPDFEDIPTKGNTDIKISQGLYPRLPMSHRDFLVIQMEKPVAGPGGLSSGGHYVPEADGNVTKEEHLAKVDMALHEEDLE